MKSRLQGIDPLVHCQGANLQVQDACLILAVVYKELLKFKGMCSRLNLPEKADLTNPAYQ